MVSLLQEACILCGGCEALCPEECIVVYEAHLELDQGRCTECGACIHGCPSGALVPAST